jgi:putative SOS response-associated peptidase YedK
MMRWGLIPFFAKGEPPPKYSTINARIETFETAASYRGPWKRGQRCLQLPGGFYEWHLDENDRKAPYLIKLNDQEVFAFAGLWDRSIKADGTAVESCVHITMPANDLMKKIHNTGNNPHIAGYQVVGAAPWCLLDQNSGLIEPIPATRGI